MNEPLISIDLDRLADLVAEQLEHRRRWAEIDGVADYLGSNVRRVRDLRERGLPARRIGKRLIFDLREVDEWIEREGVRV
jgi:hypothetical protein